MVLRFWCIILKVLISRIQTTRENLKNRNYLVNLSEGRCMTAFLHRVDQYTLLHLEISNRNWQIMYSALKQASTWAIYCKLLLICPPWYKPTSSYKFACNDDLKALMQPSAHVQWFDFWNDGLILKVGLVKTLSIYFWWGHESYSNNIQ